MEADASDGMVQTLREAITTKTPRFTKSVLGFVGVLYIIQLIFPSTRLVMALTAAFIFETSTGVIQIFTSPFLEVHLWSVIVNCVLFVLQGRYLEPIWGTKGFFKFILVVNLASSLSSYVALVFLYMITRSEYLLYHYYWCGFAGTTSALLVGIKQLAPEFSVGYGPVAIRAQYFPMIIVLSVPLAALFGFVLPSAPFIFFGTYYGWLYLRFFQRHGNVVGDLNETFAFSSFFPEVLSPIVSTGADAVYRVFDMCGVFKWLGVGEIEESRAEQMNSADAERRRKKAAIALEKRLAQTTPTGPELA